MARPIWQRILIGLAIGAIGGAMIGVVFSGVATFFDPEKAERIGFIGFVEIFSIAGAASSAIQSWARDLFD